MTTHRSTWKKREQQAAGIFGARRQICSGSSGRDDQTRSDSTHPTLFIETKLRANLAIRTLWGFVAGLAKKEKKTPVLALYTKNQPGALIVVHENDLLSLAVEVLVARDDEELLMIERDVRVRRGLVED